VATDRITTELEGLVTQVNGNGFKVEGRADWLNLSRFADPPPTLPDKADRVRVGLDKAGFVRVIAVLNATETRQNANLGARAPESIETPDKDTQIRRMACLNTAVALLSSGGQAVDAGELLDVAGLLEAWVNR